MQFNLRGLGDVLTWQVNWLDANLFLVILSLIIYGVIIVGCLVAIEFSRMNEPTTPRSIEARKQETYKDMKNIFLFLLLPLLVFMALGHLLELLGVIA